MRLKELRHVISTKQFLDKEILEELFHRADDMEKDDRENNLNYSLRGKLLANLFYEASTRTRFSFDAAMQKLGGRVIDTESAGHFSSVTKGESLPDTIRIIAGYADAIVMRHPKEGSAKIAADTSPVPMINAGDGIGEHPTQALLDIYTIRKELNRIDNLTIAMVGDLLFGRTIHSLLHLLALYKVKKIYLVSPPQLKLPEKYLEYLKEKGIEFEEVELKDILHEIDVLYVTRIQKERFESEQAYNEVKDSFVINNETIKNMKEDAIIMHPLPRVNEISPEVDSDKRAAYFRQAKNGMYIRMALLYALLK